MYRTPRETKFPVVMGAAGLRCIVQYWQADSASRFMSHDAVGSNTIDMAKATRARKHVTFVAIERRGSKEGRKQGGTEARKQGSKEARKQGSKETLEPFMVPAKHPF